MQAWKKLADKWGIYFDEEIKNRLRGVGRMDSFEITLKKSDKEYVRKKKMHLQRRRTKLTTNFLFR